MSFNVLLRNYILNNISYLILFISKLMLKEKNNLKENNSNIYVKCTICVSFSVRYRVATGDYYKDRN